MGATANTQRCPECGSIIGSIDDVEFIEWDTKDIVSIKAPKVLYLVACVDCEAAIGGGVAAAGG